MNPQQPDDDAYPAEWGFKAGPADQVALAVDSYVASLSDNELDDLLARTRHGGSR
jgi:hypothetical protein